jgi:hypothetical protein
VAVAVWQWQCGCVALTVWQWLCDSGCVDVLMAVWLWQWFLNGGDWGSIDRDSDGWVLEGGCSDSGSGWVAVTRKKKKKKKNCINKKTHKTPHTIKIPNLYQKKKKQYYQKYQIYLKTPQITIKIPNLLIKTPQITIIY